MFGSSNQPKPDDTSAPANGDENNQTDAANVPTLPSMFSQNNSQDNAVQQPDSTPAAEPTSVPDKDNAGQSSIAPDAPEEPTMPSAPVATDSLSGVSDDLVQLKQDALQHLSPLVSHLDQTPEERFRTTMMMIQATDDQSLLKSAYEAAQKIDDDKARAQALLDVINEINYFTQQHKP